MCRTHYMRWWRGEIEAAPPNPPKALADVFWSKVDKSGPCWPWTTALSGNGYGQFWDFERKRHRLAHRVSYELTYGDLDDALVIDHKCRNHACVRPDHLEQVTQSVNVTRGYAPPVNVTRMRDWSKQRTHCKWNHELTPGNTYVTREGWRQCRTCRRLRKRAKKGRACGQDASG